MKKARLRIMFASGGLLTLLACNALIGTHDLTYDPDLAGGDDSGADGPLDNRDGMVPTDALVDATTCPGVDLTMDPKNCGRCAHDCLGGLCTASTCQPTKLYSGTGATFALAVDTTNIYFSDISNLSAGALYTMPKDAPAPSSATQIAGTPDPLIYDIVADAKGVYFSWGSSAFASKGALETIAPDGGGRHALMTDASIARGLSLNNTNVYFAHTYLNPVQVGTVARSATNATATILSNNEPGVDNTFVSGTYVYWGGANTDKVRFCTADPNGCSVTLKDFLSGLNASQSLGGNAKNLFISGFEVLYQADKSGSAPTAAVAAAAQPQVFSIAADDKDIYWLDLGTSGKSFNDGSIRHCPIDATGAAKCTVANGEIVATSDQTPRVIVMDAKAVYWTVQGEGAVYRLAR